MDLSQIDTALVTRLLALLTAREVSWPPSGAEVALHNLQGVQERCAPLFGLSEAACVAVLQAVRAERAAQPEAPRLVWTGPDVGTGVGRDTAILIRDLLAGARAEVIICGYSIDHGAEIFAPLHLAMAAHQVGCEMFLDVPAMATPGEVEDYVAEHGRTFLARNWPFGAPWPRLFYDPRTPEHRSRVSLHAKCVLVDEHLALVTSANFTMRGQLRNVEVGALISHQGYVKALSRQIRRLQRLGLFKPMPATMKHGIASDDYDGSL